MEDTSIYRKALDTFGGNMQTVVCMEEMAELIKELSKTVRGSVNVQHIAEEIADVQIMLKQMILFYDMEDFVEDWKDYKLIRLRKLIEQTKQRSS